MSNYEKYSIQIVCHSKGNETPEIIPLMEGSVGEIKSILECLPSIRIKQ
jgi:hypothetical protein